jgi:hypothetical protein
MPFVDLAAFSSSRWPSWAFLDLWSSSCALWGLGFKIQTLCFVLSMDSSRRRLKNQVVSTLVWYVISHWHAEDWIQFWDILGVLPLFLVHVENRVCLSHSVQVAGAAWRALTRIEAGVGDLMQRIGDGQAQVRYSLSERLRGQVMLCAVCTVHKETRSAGFLV